MVNRHDSNSQIVPSFSPQPSGYAPDFDALMDTDDNSPISEFLVAQAIFRYPGPHSPLETPRFSGCKPTHKTRFDFTVQKSSDGQQVPVSYFDEEGRRADEYGAGVDGFYDDGFYVGEVDKIKEEVVNSCSDEEALDSGGEGDEGRSGSAQETANGSLDEIRSLVIQQISRDNKQTADMLKISHDPVRWTEAECRKWLAYTYNEYGIQLHAPDLLSVDGRTLCQLTIADFRQLCRAGHDTLFAQLDIWKTTAAYTKTNPELRSHRSQSATATFNFNNDNDISAYLWPSTEPITPYIPTTNNSTVTNSFKGFSYEVDDKLFDLGSDQLAGHWVEDRRSSPVPTVPDVGALPPASVSPSTACSSTDDETSDSAGEHPGSTYTPFNLSAALNQQIATNQINRVLTSQTATSSFQMSSQIKQEMPHRVATPPSPMAVIGGRSYSHIHLWQFLKELLEQPDHYRTFIRWVDRSKAVFKIEDSVRVAKLWGKRKNRPAMNYDKLSRSIRQYYKKGIMKKTERSQRLVYQFCHPYGL